MSNFNKVKTFMETFGQEVKKKPSFSTDKINKLRYDLIKEELDEKGKPIYNETGKVMKGPKYFKPNLSKFVN